MFTAVVVCAYLLAALYLATPLMPMTSSTFLGLDANGWAAIQAIGSIVAIFTAGWFIRWQVDEQGRQQRDLLKFQQAEQQRQRSDDDIRRLQIVASAFFHCRALLETMKRRASREVPIDAELGHLVYQAEAMYAIPAMEVPDARATYAIASARSAIETLRRELSNIDDTGGRAAQAREKPLNVALAYLESHEETVADCLRNRHSNPLHQRYTFEDGSVTPLQVFSFGHPGQFGLEASDFPATPEIDHRVS